MKLFDAHCHLQLSQFDADRVEVIARMQKGEVGGIVVGTDFETSEAAVALAQRLDFLWASVGLHPNDNKSEDFDVSKYEELALGPKVVAIGECGLDYFRSGSTPEEKAAQQKRFEKHIELAIQVNKTLIIHCRNAHEDCFSILQKTAIAKKIPVIMHFFTGSGELAQQYLDLGCYLSFPGPITFTDMYDDSIRSTPLDRILAETDAPFAAPVPYRGKRNEPTYVVEVIKKIAQVKNLSEKETAEAIVANAHAVISIPQ